MTGSPIQITPPVVSPFTTYGDSVTYYVRVSNYYGFPINVTIDGWACELAEDNSYLLDVSIIGQTVTIWPGQQNVSVGLEVHYDDLSHDSFNFTGELIISVNEMNLAQNYSADFRVNIIPNVVLAQDSVSGFIGPNVFGYPYNMSSSLYVPISNNSLLADDFEVIAQLLTSPMDIVMMSAPTSVKRSYFKVMADLARMAPSQNGSANGTQTNGT